jgi:uncharacterized protein YbjT (DUF2867 family)
MVSLVREFLDHGALVSEDKLLYKGSSICKRAVARNWDVHSLSRSGRVYSTPKGHSPAWTQKVLSSLVYPSHVSLTACRKQVTWHAGSAQDPSSYSHLLPSVTAVVHTLGVLLETDYKSGGITSLVEGLLAGEPSNPLDEKRGTYDRINRDSGRFRFICFDSPTTGILIDGSALSVFRAFQESIPPEERRPFVYLSAEDVFRPLVPSRYISTKREAEEIISSEAVNVRPVFSRPGRETSYSQSSQAAELSNRPHLPSASPASLDLARRDVGPFFHSPVALAATVTRHGARVAVPSTRTKVLAAFDDQSRQPARDASGSRRHCRRSYLQINRGRPSQRRR